MFSISSLLRYFYRSGTPAWPMEHSEMRSEIDVCPSKLFLLSTVYCIEFLICYISIHVGHTVNVVLWMVAI